MSEPTLPVIIFGSLSIGFSVAILHPHQPESALLSGALSLLWSITLSALRPDR